MLTLYFAYASNMDERRMRVLCPSARCLGAARLEAHRLAFTRRSVVSATGVADVVADVGAEVWGVLYELDAGDMGALDRKEGLGWAYARERMPVRLAGEHEGERREAAVYVVIAKERDEVAPSREYLDGVICAAERHDLPEGYVASLRRRAAAERA